jgi:hypothetical protein
MRYFKKAILSQNIFKDRDGKTIAWEILPGNTGVIALDPLRYHIYRTSDYATSRLASRFFAVSGKAARLVRTKAGEWQATPIPMPQTSWPGPAWTWS